MEQMEQGQRQPQGVSKDAECPIGFVGGMPVRRHRTARSGMMEGRDRREAFGCGRVRVNRSWVCWKGGHVNGYATVQVSD